MDGYETYKTYLSLKLHFSKDNYDFFKFNGKTRSNPESFEKRKDKYFFKKISSKFDDNTIIEYFVSLFVNDKSTWIGNILDRGNEEVYKSWKKKTQSISYLFEEDIDKLINKYEKLDSWFSIKSTHPPIIKEYLSGNIHLETVVILNKLLNFVPDLDKRIADPVIWPELKRKILKYSPFLQIDKSKYKGIVLRKV
jgi:hypothetical protein